MNINTSSVDIAQLVRTSNSALAVLSQPAPGTSLKDAEAELSSFLKPTGKFNKDKTFADIAVESRAIVDKLSGKKSFRDLPASDRTSVRSNMYLASAAIAKLDKQHNLTDANKKVLSDYKGQLEKVTKFIPNWVKIAVAFALGLGTMIGWKRIVVTVGEKIGKDHLTYGQGASAELMAMATIFAADHYGLPVSTTHVLSSGVAGTMAANGSGLQWETVRNILLAWVLTLPVCVVLGGSTYAAGLFIVQNILHLS
ncbi:MAG: inorganic phosphate transporter [Nostocaceae cyanobacterium]|nr:inorganic phosphate transporter [Nostocaceae cyanobacterium]